MMDIYELVGKKIKVYFHDNTTPIIVGTCLSFNSELDNDTDYASIDVKADNGIRYELMENEISKIEVISLK